MKKLQEFYFVCIRMVFFLFLLLLKFLKIENIIWLLIPNLNNAIFWCFFFLVKNMQIEAEITILYTQIAYLNISILLEIPPQLNTVSRVSSGNQLTFILNLHWKYTQNKVNKMFIENKKFANNKFFWIVNIEWNTMMNNLPITEMTHFSIFKEVKRSSVRIIY